MPGMYAPPAVDDPNTRQMLGIRRPLFHALISLIAPPLPVESFALITTSTPDTRPTPPMNPAPVVCPGTSLPASAAISKKYESRSSSSSIRSRGSNLPAALCRLVYFSPPPTVASTSALPSFASAAAFASRFATYSGARASTRDAITGYRCSATARIVPNRRPKWPSALEKLRARNRARGRPIRAAMKAILTTILLASTVLTGVAHADDMSPAAEKALEDTILAAQVNLNWKMYHPLSELDDLPPEAKIREQAAACSAAVADALAHKADPAMVFRFFFDEPGGIVNKKITLGEAEEKICKPTAEQSVGFDDRRAKAKAAAIEAKLGPNKKLGVAGDKLALVDKHWTQVLGPNQADTTPQVVAKSSDLFSLNKDDEWNYTLIRYQFRGNTQVSAPSQSFHHAPAPAKYRKRYRSPK